jgi:hypothetical protein
MFHEVKNAKAVLILIRSELEGSSLIATWCYDNPEGNLGSLIVYWA